MTTEIEVSVSDNYYVDPEITVWPECSRCGRSYVIRRVYRFDGSRMWVWQADCSIPKCRRESKPVLIKAVLLKETTNG